MLTLDRVTAAHITSAASMRNVDAAALFIQEIASIKDGDIAGVLLPRPEEWTALDSHEREACIELWLMAEAAYGDDDEPSDPRFTVEVERISP